MKLSDLKQKNAIIASAAMLAAIYYGLVWQLACIVILWNILIFPLRLGEKNNKDSYEMTRIRIATLAFGWAILPYFYAIYIATTKHEF